MKLLAAAALLVLGCSSGPKPAASPQGVEDPWAWEGERPDSIYFVLVDRFANGDERNDSAVDRDDPQGWHGGDLAGVRQHLDHIANMGFSRIWLSPIFETRDEKFHGHGAFHGYWTTSLKAIDSRFGTRTELEALGNELVAHKMSMMLDVVLNHVGYEAPLLSEHPDWFHGKGSIKDWDSREQLETFDVHGLPDLDQSKPQVFEHLLEGSSRWLGLPGLSGFRLDAVKHVSAAFWSRYNQAVASRAGSGFDLLGELYDGDPQLLSAALREQSFGLVFDFPLYFAMIDVFCKGASPEALAAVLSLDRLYPDPTRLVTFADNHDLPRLASACGKRDYRVASLVDFQLTARGIPMVTYGTEIGLEGKGEPANRGDMLFPRTPSKSMQQIRRLLEARREHPSLTSGRTEIIRTDPSGIVLSRQVGGERALIGVAAASGPGIDFAVPTTPSQGKGLGTDEAQILDRYGTIKLEKGRVRVAPGRVGVVIVPPAPLPKAGPRTVVFTITGQSFADLRIVGAGPELGHWNPVKAPKFEGDRLELTVPHGVALAYKLVALTPAGQPRWEGGGNRYLHVTRNSKIELLWRD